ncbi:MAG: hypothetical protein ACYDCH_07195 [Gaiellaceae bacterium]
MTELSNQAHLFAHPSEREPLNYLFTEILGLAAGMSIDAPGYDEPVLAYRFANGASISVEFTQQLPHGGETSRGAWLELVVDDPGAVRRAVLDAGLQRVESTGNEHFYFEAPNGQVFRIAGR